MRPLLFLLLCLPALADDVVLNWDASSSSNQVAGYRIYYGTSANPAASNAVYSVSLPKPGASAIMTNVGIGIAHFQATAYLTNGVESTGGNEVTYTNRNFAPVNLRITTSTNQTVALWIEHWPATATVERSADNANWQVFASIKSFEPGSDIRSLFVTAIRPADAFFWRVSSPAPVLAAGPPLPAGLKLVPVGR
jgi:hypothetical protein